MPIMKRGFFIVYCAIEAILFVTLLVFQSLTAAGGYAVFDRSAPYGLPIGILQVSLTVTSLLFACIILFSKRNVKRERMDLFPFYFLLITIADIFFSLTPYALGGHIGFFLAYLLFFFLRKGRLWELGIALLFGAAALVMFIVLKKMKPAIGVDCFLGGVLFINALFSFLSYRKEKGKRFLVFGIALCLILISDASIAGRTFVTSFPANHIIAFLTWPTYLVGNGMLLYSYFKTARK